MPSASAGNVIVSAAQFAPGVVDSAAIAADTIVAADVAANAIGDSEIVAHTTTKITSPFSLVTGTVPIAQGGTANTTAGAAFDALSPVTTRGDIIFRNATTNARLAAGAAGTVLTANGATTDPTWTAVSAQPAWVDEGTLTFSGGTSDQTLTFTNAGKNLYMIIMEITVSSATINFRLNADSGTAYQYTTQATTTFTNSTGQTEVPICGSGTYGFTAKFYIQGSATGHTIFGQASSSNTSALVLYRAYYSATSALSSIVILQSGTALTGKLHAYSLNL